MLACLLACLLLSPPALVVSEAALLAPLTPCPKQPCLLLSPRVRSSLGASGEGPQERRPAGGPRLCVARSAALRAKSGGRGASRQASRPVRKQAPRLHRSRRTRRLWAGARRRRRPRCPAAQSHPDRQRRRRGRRAACGLGGAVLVGLALGGRLPERRRGCSLRRWRHNPPQPLGSPVGLGRCVRIRVRAPFALPPCQGACSAAACRSSTCARMRAA